MYDTSYQIAGCNKTNPPEPEHHPSPQDPALSEEHRRMLEEESGISPEIIEERGYRTVESSAELSEFKKYQRRPGLLIPVYSPSGRTSFRLRPDRPRRGKDGKPIKYEQPANAANRLDVHPRNMEKLRDVSVPLWNIEGEKKADCAASHRLCPVALPGVWGWCAAGTHGEELSPDWDHIPLESRRVYIVFDSDVMVKENVQLALARFVAALERRGADVRVVYLPGPEKGVDDYLVAGGSVAELKALARKFEPDDLGRIRLSRDEKLKALIEDLERRWRGGEWKGRGGFSDKDVALKLIEAAAKSGKVHADGIRIEISWGRLEVEAKVSRQTLSKALMRLEERGLLYRDNAGRKADKTGAFVMRAKVDQYGEERRTEGEETHELGGCDPGGLPLRAPRLRWSRPAYTPRRGTVSATRKVRESKPSALRERIERLGKIRGGVVDVLLHAGGSCTLAELCEALHRSRPRDLRRRVLPALEEAGIIAVEDDAVRLAEDWEERLREARELGAEIEADDLAEERRKRKSRAFRERNKVQLSHHPANAGADGFIEDVEKLPSPPDTWTLYALVDQRVDTTRGQGRLFQVFSDEARVVLDDDPTRWVPLDPAEIRGAA